MSTATTCPHCSSAIPPEFSSMPICYMCGGDLKAAPSAPVWSAVDIRTDNTRTCKKCGESIKSVLALACPNCGADVPPPGMSVDAEEEKKKFEEAVTASNKPSPEPQIVSQPAPVATPVVHQQTHSEPPPVVSQPAPMATPVVNEPKQEPKSMKEKAQEKEGFFSKLLRMLGLKK